MTPSGRLATYFHVHLISDSTGETLNAMIKAVCARFDNVSPIEHIYPLVRSPRQLERILKEIEDAPGVVIHTVVDRELRVELESACRSLETPCLAALDPLTAAFGRYLGAQLTTRVGAQHALDAEYFERIEALNYAIGHDDGAGFKDLESADVVLVGVSRTSKTPTSIYLAHRGVRAANVPLAPGVPPPDSLFKVKKPLVVGLLVSPERLLQVRRNRLLSLNENRGTNYVDAEAVREEIIAARRMFERHEWPVIDVTRRSVEETAAAVINLLNARKVAALMTGPVAGTPPPPTGGALP
jgi:regulator of PEP synthase PpsR (kinase-PPPase family)